MTYSGEQLSAFLDGELPEDEMRAIEAALADDPALMAELEALMAGDKLARDAFDAMAEEPVPTDLAAAIKNAPDATPANLSRPLPAWTRTAAALLLLALGSTGGYYAGLSQRPVAEAPGWLAAIADYHAVYEAQSRHLVEVPAAEADHIQTWLTASVGAEVRIPDLVPNGLTFEGARLLVAAGKPVAQLMYTDTSGTVVALCLIATATPQDGFANRTLGGFDMVTWGGRDANFVVVGPTGRADLSEIAESASTQV